MQYNVPQFTDTEDKVIGPLTVRQFIILIAAGGLVFLTYSGSKSIPVTAVVGLLVSLPALVAVFGQYNGRKLYRILPVFLQYFTVPKIYVFEKEAKTGAASSHVQAAAVKVEARKASGTEAEDVHSRLQRIEYQLNQRKSQAEKIVEHIKH